MCVCVCACMFRVIAELILRISLPVGVLPNEMVALLPYTLSEAICLLFIGASSAHYTVSLEDPLSILEGHLELGVVCHIIYS